MHRALASGRFLPYTTVMTKAQKGNENRIAFPICLFENEGEGSKNVTVSDEIHVVPTGKWEHWSGSEFEITPETITAMVKNFKEAGRKDIPITAGHDNGMSGGELPAVGWFKELTDRGVNGLYAFVEWNAEGMRLFREKQFKYFSAEIAFDFKDLESGREYEALLVGGALTNKPFFKSLKVDPASFSEAEKAVLAFSVPDILNQFNDNNHMDLQALLAKAVGELTAEEKAFIKEHKDELSDDQKVSHAEVIADEPAAKTAEEIEAERVAEETRVGDENEAKGLNRDGSVKEVAASEKKPVNGVVTLSAAEYAALQGKADQGATAFAEVEKMKLEKGFDAITLSATNKTGKFLFKQKDAYVAFMQGLSTKQRDQFTNLVNSMPKAADIFSEIGNDGGVDSTAQKQIDLKVEELRKKDTKLGYSEALKIVLKENPDLEKQATEESASAE